MKTKFEFDTRDEDYNHSDIKFIASIPEIRCALYDLSDLLSIIVNRKIYGEDKYLIKDEKMYIKEDYIEDKLRTIYEQINHLIEE